MAKHRRVRGRHRRPAHHRLPQAAAAGALAAAGVLSTSSPVLAEVNQDAIAQWEPGGNGATNTAVPLAHPVSLTSAPKQPPSLAVTSSGHGSTLVGSTAPRSNRSDYVVISGDTLSGIAVKENVAGGWQALLHANRTTVPNHDLIYVNEQLMIPGTDKPPAVQTSAASTGKNLVWPFPTKDPSQMGRTDQGWDLVSTPGGEVRAIAAGTIHGPTIPDANGFGSDYAIEHLDSPIRGFTDVYYGHTHLALTGHVPAGAVIAHTGGGGYPRGGNGELGEVEVGFGNPNTGVPWSNGPLMKAALQ